MVPEQELSLPITLGTSVKLRHKGWNYGSISFGPLVGITFFPYHDFVSFELTYPFLRVLSSYKSLTIVPNFTPLSKLGSPDSSSMLYSLIIEFLLFLFGEYLQQDNDQFPLHNTNSTRVLPQAPGSRLTFHDMPTFSLIARHHQIF